MLHKVICFQMITALTTSTTLLIKVFEYFASDRSSEGEVLMKPADLMRAVVPVFLHLNPTLLEMDTWKVKGGRAIYAALLQNFLCFLM